MISACSNKGFYHKNGNMIYKEEQNEIFNTTENNDQYGFVRQVKSENEKFSENQKVPQIDREWVADSVSQLLVSLPQVNDASVVVTDKEILIAYTNESDHDHTSINEQVIQTAQSIVPAWYSVYASDVPYIRQDIENIASIDANTPNRRETIKQVIELIKKENEKKVNE